MLAYVGPMLACAGPMLIHLGGYVGHTLGICWLSWAYVGEILGNLCRKISSDTTFYDFSFPQSKNTGKPTFLNISKMKFSAAEGPKTL